MTSGVLVIDIFAIVLIVVGFMMTFRQQTVRRLLHSEMPRDPDDEDGTTYALRVAGTMLMAFGAALAILFTMFAHLSR